MADYDIATETKNHGQMIQYIRKSKGMKQEVLAARVHMSQQAVSRYEQMKIIDDSILERFAKALDVSIEYIKEYNHEATVNYITTNNTVENGAVAGTINNLTVNTLDKVVELYDTTLKDYRKKITQLEKLLKEKGN